MNCGQEDLHTIHSVLGATTILNIPTRVRHNFTTCLDHIFITNKRNVGHSISATVITKNYTIDQYPFCLQFKATKSKSKNENDDTPDKREMSDYKKLYQLAEEINWSSILQTQDPQVGITKLVDSMKTLIKKLKRKIQKKK